MTPLRILQAAIVATALLALNACGPLQVRDEDANLGALREKSPGDIYAEMGREYLKQGQPTVALRKLKHGLEVDPDNAQIHAVLGLLYQRLGEHGPANRHYATASELEPQNPYFHNAWGSYLCQQEDFPAADRQFRLALANPLYDRPWQAATNAGVCALRAGDTEAAEGYLRRALSGNPQVALALQKMMQITLQRQDYTEAAGYLQRYERVASHTPQTLLQGMRIQLGLNDTETAARYRDALQARYPDAPETRTATELSQP